MMEELFSHVLQRALTELLRDSADLLITYYLIYRVLLVLRGTRAVQIGLGLAFLIVLYGVSKYFELGTLFAILGTVLPNAILIIVVVFQDDIRRGLMRMDSGAFLGTGRYQCSLWKDVSEARPNELSLGALDVSNTDTLKVHLALDGGFVARLTPAQRN